MAERSDEVTSGVIFTVQGSSPEPYKITVNFKPFTISCTCQAAVTGQPCKHRIHILKGYCVDMVSAPDNYDEILSVIKDAALNSPILQLLNEYDTAKKSLKAKNDASEKLFKKYRDAVIASTLKKGSKKATEKASANLDEALQSCVDVAAEVEARVQCLRTIFIRPGHSNTSISKTLAEQAVQGANSAHGKKTG